jgi:L-amino acid N-acyltransferase YncA
VDDSAVFRAYLFTAIYLQPEVRGQGYSSQLLTTLKQHLRERGFVALLSSSQTDEPEPQAWHTHMGFTSNGIIENIADDNVGKIVYRLML